MIGNIENIMLLGFNLLEIALMIFGVVLTALIILIPIHIFRIKSSLQSIDKKMTRHNDLAALNIKKMNELIELQKKK